MTNAVREVSVRTSGFRSKLTRGKSLKRKPTNLLKRKKSTVQGKLKPRKKGTMAIRREWCIPDSLGSLRYKGLRGIYWYWLSRQVRKDEWEKWGGECITCLKPIEHWTLGHCGHIIAAQHCGEYLRFNKINLTIQHSACNSDRITPDAAALNAIHYDLRFGEGAWEKLRALKKKECSTPKQAEYRALIEALPSYQEAKRQHEIK